MKPHVVLDRVITPTLGLMGAKYQGDLAERMLVANGLQESKLQHRVQIGGPARGLWQFEKAGGVRGVMKHVASRNDAAWLCAELDFPFDEAAIYEAIRWNDMLACGFARLLLWTDPRPLPVDEASGWQYYLRTWRPGKPHKETWSEYWHEATLTAGVIDG